MQPVKLLVIGAGSRGQGYASFAKRNPDQAQVVGVAEPREFYREALVREHGIAADNVFMDWRDALRKERFADAVLICTQDADHAGPAIEAAARGYHILLEKPISPSEADCRAVVAAVKKAGVIFAVCHVLRYTVYTRNFKAMVDSGLIGPVVNIQHLEPVGYWHQAHSYVRGNARNEAESSFMLLAKSCHDLDWILHIMGGRCTKVSSFGSLFHFKRANQPAGAADRCVDCGVESTCPYSALKIYLGFLKGGHTGWPVDVLTPDVTNEGVGKALREGPFGRCVYACDNDVVDTQVVNMLFADGRTASFTMTAFTETTPRRTRAFGTRGMLEGDGQFIRHFDFLTDRWQVVNTDPASDNNILNGHGGGDAVLIKSFVEAVARNDASLILSGPEQTLESHMMVFAAERARRNETVEDVTL